MIKIRIMCLLTRLIILLELEDNLIKMLIFNCQLVESNLNSNSLYIYLLVHIVSVLHLYAVYNKD